MTTTEPTLPMRRTAVRLILPFAALALAACAQGGPAAEPTEQETAVQSSTPGPDTPTPPEGGAGPVSEAPSAPSVGSALLTISIAQDASADPVQYVLECVDGAPGPASTHPDAATACAALGRLGVEFFTARPNKDVICTQQYGGPQTASIIGDVDGTPVLAAFALTDGCEISRWRTAQDILGTPGGQ